MEYFLCFFDNILVALIMSVVTLYIDYCSCLLVIIAIELIFFVVKFHMECFLGELDMVSFTLNCI